MRSSPIPHRRQVLRSMVGGSLLLPGLLSELLADGPAAASSPENPLAPRAPHFAARAKRVIFLYMTGGVSHIDTFDPKSSANGHDGFERPDKLMGSVFPYSADPQTGIEVTDIFGEIRQSMEHICLIRTMRSAHFDHTEATLGMHTCSAAVARPSYGAWLSYGLGTENQNLPSFVVIAPELAYGGTQGFSNDFLPACHQGTRIIPGAEPIADLTPRSHAPGLQTMELDFTRRLNDRHLAERAGDSALAARIRAMETAFQMQMSAPEALDIRGESQATLRLYGIDAKDATSFGWQCLAARRLAERGVRVIELIHMSSGSNVNWDAHSDLKRYNKLAPQVDRPIAGLLKDLHQRGMLDETIVVFATEFGRTPARDGELGRQHHGHCFSVWVAGGGFKRGHVHGQTDERGYSIVDGQLEVYDLHATILHQMGLDHRRLTYRHAGRDFRLTDVHGRVAEELLA